MRIRSTLAAAVALLAFAAPAQATKIIGEISFSGFVRPIGSSDMSSATGLDFFNFISPPTAANDGGMPGTIFAAIGGSGVFGGLTCAGPCGSIKDLPTFSPAPITSFIDIGSTIFFDLSSITSVTTQTDPVGGSLKLIAAGKFRISGFDDTAAILTLTTQGRGITSFSASAVDAPAVPEPATWALMIGGFGLAGGALRARRSARVSYAAN